MNIPPIAMLHHVSDDPAYASLKPYCISREAFIRLVDYLSRFNYQTITFGDLISGNRYAKSPGKKIILTFDDCPKHLLDFALPELVRRNMRAVFYLPVAHIGTCNSWDVEEGRARVELMSEEDIRYLAGIGMEIGSHAMHHLKMKELANEQLVKAELLDSKKLLEEITQQEIYSFAYPYGSVPVHYTSLLKEAGYRYGLSIYQPFQNRFALRRFIYHDGDTETRLKRKLSTAYAFARAITDPLKKYP